MSASLVDHHVVRYLLESAMGAPNGWAGINRTFTWYHHREHHELNDANASAIGQMLLDENVQSYSDRYSDHIPTLPQNPLDQLETYQHIRIRPFQWDPVQTIKSLDYYDYQSCEHTTWQDSKAKAFVDNLRSAAWHNLPGYDEAFWGAPGEDLPLPTANNALKTP